ncbi:MAG: SDR family oxidoreductase [Acidimicrobiales bacterium]|nr:SDR family oxidoreductase [Acidimicrobiales bacterium]
MSDPTRQRTVVVTGSASGMGAATCRRLEQDGQRVIGVDLRDANVVADLSTAEGRRTAIDGVTALADGSIDGIVTWAGVSGLTDRPGRLVAAVNYFGTVEVLEGLRPLLAAGDRPAAVVVSSNSTSIQPGVPMGLVDALLAGDEEAALAVADEGDSFAAYPASKLAVARWCRRRATHADWAGAGIRLNAVLPGAVETPLLQASRDDVTVGQFIDALPVPSGGPGTADELAGVVMFMLGPDARFLVGSLIVADGGSDALIRPDSVPVPLP